MSLVNTETGELVEFDAAAAERRAERITLRLDAIADNYRAVLPMIREAIEKRDDIALGYRSPGDYVSDRFGQSLAGLGIEVRRAVVGELTQAGLSTRAIAPVVGVSHEIVRRDQGVNKLTPAPPAPQGEAAPSVAPQAPVDSKPVQGPRQEPSDVALRPAVTGIDGKTYSPPAPRATPRKPLADTARDAGWDLRKSIERLQRIAEDDRFATNKPQVAPLLRSHLENAVEVCQDLLARIDN